MLHSSRLKVGIILIFIAYSCSLQAKQQTLDWQNLLPKLDAFADPFKKLTATQIDDLGYYVALSDDIANIEHKNPEHKSLPKLKQEQTLMSEMFTSHHINVEYLLSQRAAVTNRRKLEATAVNDDVINKTFVIKGYLVPEKSTNGLVSKSFLVVESPHLNLSHDHDAPEPNQVIYVDFKDKPIKYSKQQITITGQLTKVTYSAGLKSMDGHDVNYQASYLIDISN
ncbi:DUF3299 domain-containing protein [Colwelliaceae bacterium BS250]